MSDDEIRRELEAAVRRTKANSKVVQGPFTAEDGLAREMRETNPEVYLMLQRSQIEIAREKLVRGRITEHEAAYLISIFETRGQACAEDNGLDFDGSPALGTAAGELEAMIPDADPEPAIKEQTPADTPPKKPDKSWMTSEIKEWLSDPKDGKKNREAASAEFRRRMVRRVVDVCEAATQAAQTSPDGRLVGAGDFALDEPEAIPALWGDDDQVLAAEGEGFMICGHQGTGKSTLVQQLVLHRSGLLDGLLLGMTVKRDDRPTLILAMDRPGRSPAA